MTSVLVARRRLRHGERGLRPPRTRVRRAERPHAPKVFATAANREGAAERRSMGSLGTEKMPRLAPPGVTLELFSEN